LGSILLRGNGSRATLPQVGALPNTGTIWRNSGPFAKRAEIDPVGPCWPVAQYLPRGCGARGRRALFRFRLLGASSPRVSAFSGQYLDEYMTGTPPDMTRHYLGASIGASESGCHPQDHPTRNSSPTTSFAAALERGTLVDALLGLAIYEA
jgi:hypothetical protein